MIELLEQMTPWYWLGFAFALFALELLIGAGYLLWTGLSALFVALMLFLFAMDWHSQWLLFGVMSLLTAWLWWRKQLQDDRQDDANRDLNQKEKQLIGRIIYLDDQVEIGENRVRLADTTWLARANQQIPAKTAIKITAIDGITLILEPASSDDA